MGGSEHIAHIRVIQVLPVADNWIDEDVYSGNYKIKWGGVTISAIEKPQIA